MNPLPPHLRDALEYQRRFEDLVPPHLRYALEAAGRINSFVPESMQRLNRIANELSQATHLSDTLRKTLDATEKFQDLLARTVRDEPKPLNLHATSLLRRPPGKSLLNFDVSLSERAARHVHAVCGDGRVSIPYNVLENLAVGDQFEFSIAGTPIVFNVAQRRVTATDAKTHIQIVLDAASEPEPEGVSP